MNRTPEHWDARYRSGELPWDTNRPDRHLVRLAAAGRLPPGRVLEVGCGTGTNAVWLAWQGYDVTVTDVAPAAIAAARARAGREGVKIAFQVASFPDLGPTWDLVFDRGVFHTLETLEERRAFAAAVAARLDPDRGVWLSLAGSTDGPPRELGPPRRSAADLTSALEPSLELLSLEAVTFETLHGGAEPLAWLCLSRRRRTWDGPRD